MGGEDSERRGKEFTSLCGDIDELIPRGLQGFLEEKPAKRCGPVAWRWAQERDVSCLGHLPIGHLRPLSTLADRCD